MAFATFTKTSFARPVQIATYCAVVALLVLVAFDRADAMAQSQRSAGLMTRANTLASSKREILTFTLQGTVQSGSNGLVDGTPGPFGPNGSLNGKHYKLTYQFDPSYGVQTQPWGGNCPKNSIYIANLGGSGELSPGTADLSINGGSYKFVPGGSGSSAYANFGASGDYPCSVMYGANFNVTITGQTFVIYFVGKEAAYPYSLDLPVDIWLSAFWPAPNCKYTISSQVLNYDSSGAMQFAVVAPQLRASGLTQNPGDSFTVTNSLYPCKS